MKKDIFSFVFKRAIILILGFNLFVNASAQVSSQSLLVNGDFESGISGTGFQVLSPYNYVPAVSGNSSAGDYAFLTNPQPMNTAFFISTSDHSGTGKMMVVDGSTIGGQPRFWKAGGNGGGVGPLTTGVTYTFSYWVLNISTSAITAATSANIGVAWNNASNITLVSGNPQVSYPGFSAIWQKVVYSFVATTPYVNIELYNNNTSATGNDFALDDLEVLPPPAPLSARFSSINPTCPNTTNGVIAVYAQGGTSPYQYSLNGGAYTNSNVFLGLGPSTNNVVSVRDAALNTISTAPINIVAAVNPLTVRTDTTICSGAAVVLSVSGSTSPYLWSATPADPTLLNPTSATPTVRPITNTTYTVSTTTNRSVNFIFNGDFSSGDVGFNSDYTYLASNSVNYLQSVYGIVTNANNFETGFSSSCIDHTSGTGNMMVVDGATVSNRKVWQQTIPVLPNTSYVFSYWIQTVATPGPAEIETTINGQPVTGVSATSKALAPSSTCNWVLQSYNWNSGLSTSADIALYDRNITATGNDFALDDISFITSINCPVQKSVVVTVNTSGVANTNFTYASPFCTSGSNPLPQKAVGFTSGGSFTSTAGLSINSSTGEINLATSMPGSYVVTYTVVSTGCSGAGTGTASIVINTTVAAVTGFSYATPVCINASNPTPITATGFTTGGAFSSTTGLSINANTGAINLSASSAGSYTITYSLAASGCNPAASNSASIVINPSSSPVTGFSYTTPVCINATNPTPTTVAGFTTGGAFSSTTGLSINANTGIINLATSIAGSYTITYNVAASGCNPAASSTASIVINSAAGNAVTGFSYVTPVCVAAATSAPVKVAGFTAGGTFTAGSGIVIDANTGIINLTKSTIGTHTITYTVASSACGTGGSSLAGITIVANNTPVTSFSYNTPICITAPNPAPSLIPGFSTGGSFSSNSSGLVVDRNTGVVNLSASTAGSYSVKYDIAASGCNNAGSGTASIVIVLNNPIQTNFTYNTPVCINQSNPTPQKASGFTANGIFSSTPGLTLNPATGIIDLSTTTAGNYVVSYTIPANACTLNSNIGTANIDISLVPNPPATSPASRCGPGPISLRANGSGNLTWYDNAALTNPVFKGNTFTPSLNDNAVFYVTDSNANCASIATPVQAIINPLPDKPFLGNDTALCPGETIVLNAGNYTNYLWQDNSTASSFVVNQSGNYWVSVKSGGVCASSDSIAVNVLENCDDVYFPSAFSPNGDGNNERFGPLGNLFMVKSFSLKVFNRWGQMVYSSFNPYQRWDGNNISKAQHTSNFTYIATYYFRGVPRIKKGSLLLLR